jgi:hypothetical protein
MTFTKISMTILAVGMGAMWAPAAHAQCAAMTPRTAVAWSELPDNSAPAFRTEPRIGRVEPQRGGEPSIVGMWKVTFMAGGQVVDQAFETFHSDGTELMVDTAPPATGNVCTGVWARFDGVNFKLNHPSWTFDDKGNLNGTAVIKVNVLLDANSNSFTGTFTVDVMSLSGAVLQHLTGTVAAQRVNID